MKRDTGPLSYVITTDRHDTVRLSKVGHWGNFPMPSDEEAEHAARADAGARPLQIERKRIR